MKKRLKRLLIIPLLISYVFLCGFGYEITPFMGAKSESKTIYSDEKTDIEVVALGYIEELDHEEDQELHGVIKITNKTDERLPYSLQECVINGYCYTCDEECIIRPKKSYFSEFYIDPEALAADGIKSISSVSLFLMTDYEDNSSIKGEKMMGGRLYSVPLDIKGNDPTPEIDGELVYDENDIKVYVMGSVYKTYESIGFPPGVTYELLIENNTDKDITFDYSEPTCDGNDILKRGVIVASTDEEGTYANLNYEKNVIPAGCIKHDSLYFDDWAIKPSCKFTCKFDFLKPGGGQILFRSDEIEFICPKEESE